MRGPRQKEPGRVAPSIDPVFATVTQGQVNIPFGYWSSTSSTASAGAAWSVVFDVGFGGGHLACKLRNFHVRAVRSGP